MVVTVAGSQVERDVDPPLVGRERLEAVAVEVVAEAMNRPVQQVDGGSYLRGLIEDGARKSLEAWVARQGEGADYQSMQQFLADSPWDPALVVRAVAERVAPVIGVDAWVLDDTGFPRDCKDSPAAKRQYSGTLGKLGSVSSRFILAGVHAAHGSCDDARRRGWREGSEVPPREEWLIAEWPEGRDEPTDYWISNLPADTAPERLARLARMRWKVELRLQATQRRARARPLRRPLLAWLVSPHRDRDRPPTGFSP